MAHVTKFTMAAVGNMTNHYSREADDMKPRKNINIDRSKTHLNYNLAPERNVSQVEFIRQRLHEVKCQKRSDVKVMCDWVITAPKDLPADKEQQFFQSSYNFLQKKYGAENVVSAYVHKDETTPHLHFAFVPVTLDKKKGFAKVSAKEVLSRSALQSFHKDLQKHLEKDLGCRVNVLNEATKAGNMTVPELKKATAAAVIEKGQEAMASLAAASRKLDENMRKIDLHKHVEKSYGFFGSDVVKLQAAEYKTMTERAVAAGAWGKYYKAAEQLYEKLQGDTVEKLQQKLDEEADKSYEKDKIIAELQRTNKELKEQLQTFQSALEQEPTAAEIIRAKQKEIVQEKEYARIMAYKPYSEFVTSATDIFYAEMQKQLKKGVSVENIDYKKVAAAMLSEHGPATVLDTLRKHGKMSMQEASKTLSAARSMSRGISRGLGLEI